MNLFVVLFVVVSYFSFPFDFFLFFLLYTPSFLGKLCRGYETFLSFMHRHIDGIEMECHPFAVLDR